METMKRKMQIKDGDNKRKMQIKDEDNEEENADKE